jgi:altronate dehydratase large subunit
LSNAAGNPLSLDGYERPNGGVGIRNHLLVLPSVVCSTQAAQDIVAGTDAVSITHQHGCLHVGNDLHHAEDALVGAALNPNVGAVLVVGLGCETIQGAQLARRLAERQQVVNFIGIQSAGGTAAAISQGRTIVQDRLAELDAVLPTSFDPERLLVGLDRSDDPLVEHLVRELRLRGASVVLADGVRGGAAHVQLAALGAQVIVSLCAVYEAPLGFASCPVIAVARDRDTYEALSDDFDLGAFDAPLDEHAVLLADRINEVCRGMPTAAERRGAADFVLDRLAVTM